MNKIIITTGDTQGIGLEVFFKALLENPIHKKTPVLLWTSEKDHFYFPKISVLNGQEVKEVSFFLEKNLSKGLFIKNDQRSPVFWVKEASELCLKDSENMSLITGPLDKIEIISTGFRGMGHTDLIADVCGIARDDLSMFFYGSLFNVLLLTGHVPLGEVEQKLNALLIDRKLEVFYQWVYKRFGNIEKNQFLGQLVLLGLNPHAGEKGFLGRFEIDILSSIKWKEFFPLMTGPVPPDSAFINYQTMRKTYLCWYHDQGLIPFKLVHQYRGVHLTVGLPFLRLSVDHGTARDLYGQDRADASSAKECLNFLNVIKRFRS